MVRHSHFRTPYDIRMDMPPALSPQQIEPAWARMPGPWLADPCTPNDAVHVISQIRCALANNADVPATAQAKPHMH